MSLTCVYFFGKYKGSFCIKETIYYYLLKTYFCWIIFESNACPGLWVWYAFAYWRGRCLFSYVSDRKRKNKTIFLCHAYFDFAIAHIVHVGIILYILLMLPPYNFLLWLTRYLYLQCFAFEVNFQWTPDFFFIILVE